MAADVPLGAGVQGWTPVPDPTKLTTDAVAAALTQMRRELDLLKELIEARIGQLERRQSEWTTDTLRTYLEDRVAAAETKLECRLDANDETRRFLVDTVQREYRQEAVQIREEIKLALANVQRASDKAEASVEKRLEGLNELREIVAQTQQLNIQRTEVESVTQRLDERISEIAEKLTLTMPRPEAEQIVNHNTLRITELTDRFNRMEGTGLGQEAQRAARRLDTGQVVGIISLIVLVVSVAAGIIIATRH
jgi:hypothetical protein